MLTPRRRGAGAIRALLALSVGGAVATACGDSSTSSSVVQGGDDVINDTRDASPRGPANPEDGAMPTGQPDGYAGGQPDGSYGEGGSGYGGDSSVTYPGIAECATCSCPSTKSYCFGGATPRKDPMVSLGARPFAVDAGSPCPIVTGGALGCTALPAGAVDCPSLIAGLQASFLCVLVCAFDGTKMTAYCPSS